MRCDHTQIWVELLNFGEVTCSVRWFSDTDGCKKKEEALILMTLECFVRAQQSINKDLTKKLIWGFVFSHFLFDMG